MNKPKILIVDDDKHMRGSVVEFLEYGGKYEIIEATNGQEALSIIAKEKFSAIVSDIKMPIMDGLELLDNLVKQNSTVPFIIMTAFGDVKTAVEAMSRGAYYFIEKGSNSFTDCLEATIVRAVEKNDLLIENIRLSTENTTLKNALKGKWQYIGKSSKIKEIQNTIEAIASSRSTILVTGESGTGKEMIAKSIHALSNRAGGPFIKVNCAALPESLIESELFGHEKGAFTGALKTRLGKFELASSGTILLDEIGEMPLGVQAKLLRVLQEREVDKIGGDAPVSVDIRLIATTNRDLQKEIENSNFREDLYYRLNVFHFELPPLRERKDDIPELINHFIWKYNDDNGFSVTGISKEALEALKEYNFPGNIRELENIIERAVVLTRTGELSENSLRLGKSREIPPANGKVMAGMTVAQVEKELIYTTLEHCKNNKTQAAEMMDISVRTLRNKLKEYGDNSADE
ncbi:MAG: sigma-54 dependent transcriptional regulator [Chitinispirillales bacterium]|jgi:two-component system response regulator AtoC|nr:sigma-54 dependent transcriptional regulator [Chitinispirillales bacterium]